MNEFNHSWYAVITAPVLLSKDLTDKQKLLIALIGNLSNEKGYCFASNNYLSECLSCSERTVQQNISILEEKKLIGRTIKLNSKKEVEFRAIMLTIENIDPPEANFTTPRNQLHHNNIYNNISINNMPNNKNIYNKPSREKKSKLLIPPTLFEVEAFFREKGLNEILAKKAFDHYDSTGWVDSQGKDVKSWKQKMLTNWINTDSSSNYKIKSVDLFNQSSDKPKMVY